LTNPGVEPFQLRITVYHLLITDYRLPITGGLPMKRLTVLLLVVLPLTAVLALIHLFTPTAHADEVGGEITTDTTWTLAGSPYIITDDVIIQPGVMLTVEAGVEVQAQPNKGIRVNGMLLALGTAVQPITFTSTIESGLNNWHGLDVTSSGVVSLTHTTISYAYSSLEINGATANVVQLRHSTITQNNIALGSDTNAIHRLNMQNVVFVNNDNNIVLIGGGGSALADNVTLTAQPGLEAYISEVLWLTVPEGLTLTLAAGATLQSLDYLSVRGHLRTQGTVTATAVITGFSVIQVEATGSTNINHTLISNGLGDGYVGLGILGNSNQPINIQNSTIAQMVHPIVAVSDALHRLQMENVSFSNNTLNRVFIDTDFGHDTLAANVALTPQPGLEGYQLQGGTSVNDLYIPENITLTLTAGTTLMGNEHYLMTEGHLALEGSITATATLTNFSYIAFQETGSGNITHAAIYGRGGYNPGLLISGNSNKPVSVHHSSIQNTYVPIGTEGDSLHRLQMENVSFSNNTLNRVFIDTDFGHDTLAANVALTPQPGLEAYQIMDFGPGISIPENITLTLAAGTTFMGSEHSLVTEGHLAIEGNITATTTLTNFTNIVFQETGSGNIAHATIHGRGNYSPGLLIDGSSDEPVIVRHSSIENAYFPIGTNGDNLHRLQMEHVSFFNNINNRVFIFTDGDHDTLAANVTLTPQPGLEGYEVFNESLRVPSGITLTLEANTTLMLPDDKNVIVDGQLLGEGTAVSPVTFTSAEDSAPGQWDGIVVDGGEVSLTHAEVRYGTQSLTVHSPTSTVSITSSRLISASVDGIFVGDGLVNVACSVIAGNGSSGVFVADGGTPNVNVTTSEIWGNGVGITNANSLPVDARFNFWGDASGPGGAGPGSGDAIYGNVLYEPWLAQPACSPPVEPPITPTISISDSTAVESTPSLTFTVTLNLTSEQDVMVDYATMDGTAVAHTDYLPISGTLTIPAGQMTAVLTVTLLNNSLDDGNRTFTLDLSNPVNGVLGDGTAVGTILDDDSPPPPPSWYIYLPTISKP
jgi:hypothetical protein